MFSHYSAGLVCQTFVVLSVVCVKLTLIVCFVLYEAICYCRRLYIYIYIYMLELS